MDDQRQGDKFDYVNTPLAVLDLSDDRLRASPRSRHLFLSKTCINSGLHEPVNDRLVRSAVDGEQRIRNPAEMGFVRYLSLLLIRTSNNQLMHGGKKCPNASSNAFLPHGTE